MGAEVYFSDESKTPVGQILVLLTKTNKKLSLRQVLQKKNYKICYWGKFW